MTAEQTALENVWGNSAVKAITERGADPGDVAKSLLAAGFRLLSEIATPEQVAEHLVALCAATGLRIVDDRDASAPPAPAAPTMQ